MQSIELAVVLPFAEFAFFALLAMVLHELGHLVTARVLGVKVHRVGICWKGIYTVREAGAPEQNIRISMAGPLVNVLLMALWPVSPLFAFANLLCAASNLLPLPGTDGYRILNLLQTIREGQTTVRVRRAIAEMERRPVVMMPSECPEASMNPAA